MDINFKLEAFEGPLDLLLHLIEKNKIDIYDIPIVLITEQYIEYVNAMEFESLDTMSEFLVMTATLLEIKSRMLLPKKEEDVQEEDPREELVNRLLEYKLYKSISYELKDRYIDSDKILYRKASLPDEVKSYTPPIDMEELIGDMNLAKLNEVFKDIVRRSRDRIDPIRSKFGRIKKEEVSLEETFADVEEYARRNRVFSFRKLFENRRTKMQLIVTFLSVLELMKVAKIKIEQEDLLRIWKVNWKEFWKRFCLRWAMPSVLRDSRRHLRFPRMR